MTLHVMVGICAFRRSELSDALVSLSKLVVPADVDLRICVADNDGTPSAQERVMRAAQTVPFPITYLHAPERNISVARNALLDHADATSADYIAFMDDDETVTPPWLFELLKRARRTGEGLVVGPVKANYLPATPDWMVRGRFHDTFPDTDTEGVAHTGYTCNLLVDLRDARLKGLRFDFSRGRSGGEDSAYAAHYQRAGGRIGYAHAAVVTEVVPAERARMSWLFKRRFRMGQTHGDLVTMGLSRTGRAQQAGLAALKTLACVALAITPDAVRRNKALLRGALHAGAVSGCLGVRHLQLYDDKKPLLERKT